MPIFAPYPVMTRRWLLGLAATVALWPASAQAQPMACSFEDLAGLVKVETTVIVTDMKGRRVKGALSAVDHDSISLVLDGRRLTFARSEVATVRMVDGLLNGSLIGASAGAGAALGILAIVGSRDGYILPSAKVGAPVLLTGVGALVGALMDRAHDGGRVLYLSPAQTPGIVVSPFLGAHRQGVRVSIYFSALFRPRSGLRPVRLATIASWLFAPQSDTASCTSASRRLSPPPLAPGRFALR